MKFIISDEPSATIFSGGPDAPDEPRVNSAVDQFSPSGLHLQSSSDSRSSFFVVRRTVAYLQL